jgi:hypothetical protein
MSCSFSRRRALGSHSLSFVFFFRFSFLDSRRLNPVPAGWPFATGQDHLPNHALAAIDYAGIHLWPDVWSRDDRPWGVRWIQAHAENAALLGKPLVIEEFGKFVGAPPLQPSLVFLVHAESLMRAALVL